MSRERAEAFLFGKWGAQWPRIRKCLSEIVYPEGAFCCSCGRITGGGALCEECRVRLHDDGALFSWSRSDPEPGLTAWSLRPHDGIHRQLVLRLKYSAEARAAAELASLILPLPEDVSFPPDTVVTWVPMPENRRRERCVDHGQLLARAAAEKLSLPCRQLLARRGRRDKSQVTLSGEKREANLKDAFLPVEEIAFPVLLVDDVRTTGTTIRRCAAALRDGGAREIRALTFTARL